MSKNQKNFFFNSKKIETRVEYLEEKVKKGGMKMTIRKERIY